MKIEKKRFDEERALFRIDSCTVDSCRFSGKQDGESPLKETRDIAVENCDFDLRYALWHCRDSVVANCKFSNSARAPFWYDKNLKLEGVISDAPKAFRECKHINIKNCNILSEEPLWKISNLSANSCKISGFYGFFTCKNLYLDNINFEGKYSFQYCKNVVIKNSVLNTKDAFWHTEKVRVENSIIKGEYIGWYSKNLTFVNCTIESHQGFCHCKGIKFINCKLPNSDLIFEDSVVKGNINGKVDSIKNLKRGKVVVESVGSIISDTNRKFAKIITR